MSLYNIIHGFSPACFLFMPMLGRTQEEYPRFRNCFLSDDEQHIDIYTRVGGGNRGCGYGEEELMKDPNFVKTWDDEQDSTYGFYQFNVPEKWKKDFEAIKSQDFENMSDDYKRQIAKILPGMKEKLIIWGWATEETFS